LSSACNRRCSGQGRWSLGRWRGGHRVGWRWGESFCLWELCSSGSGLLRRSRRGGLVKDCFKVLVVEKALNDGVDVEAESLVLVLELLVVRFELAILLVADTVVGLFELLRQVAHAERLAAHRAKVGSRRSSACGRGRA